MTLGEKLKQLRQNKNWTQKELGIQTGMGEATIRKYELGIRNPQIAQIIKIAEALEVQPNALLDDAVIKSEYTTVADVMTLLITLDNVVGLSFDGSRDREGYLDPSTMRLRIDNQKVNKVLADWEHVRKNYLEQRQASYDQAATSLAKDPQTKGSQDLLNLMNFDPLKEYKESVDLSIIAKCRTPLDGDDEDEN